jgi:phage tail sheath gpL-like
MTTISMPQVTATIIGTPGVVDNQPQKILFIGQMTSDGTATPGVLVRQIGNSGQENDLFGENSHIAAMIRNAKKCNNVSEMDAIPLADDDEATNAVGQIHFTGTATAAGQLQVVVGSELNNTYFVDIAVGDTATNVSNNLIALIQNDTKAWASAELATGVVSLTAINAGPVGNFIALVVFGSVAGISYTLTGFSGGATNPSTTGIFDQIANIRYQNIVWPEAYTLSTIVDFTESRFNVTDNLLDGSAIVTNTNDYDSLVTLGNSLNAKTLVLTANNQVDIANQYSGGALLEYDDVHSSIKAAIYALLLTDGASIANFVNAPSSLDAFGGPALASLPLFNTPLINLPLEQFNLGFTDEEIQGLLNSGISCDGNNTSNTQLIMGQQCTTYKTNPGGNQDLTYKFQEYFRTYSNCREYIYNNLKSNYANTRLTNGDLIPGRKMANASSIRSFVLGLIGDLMGPDFVLVQAGEAALDFIKQNLFVTVDLQTGTANIQMVIPIVTQLRIINALIQVSFTTAR